MSDVAATLDAFLTGAAVDDHWLVDAAAQGAAAADQLSCTTSNRISEAQAPDCC